MVNENKGVRYNPRPVYDRKLARAVIRAQVIKKFGFHNVSKTMTQNFKRFYGKEQG